MKRLEFFYDLSSPYSYLAATQLQALGERTGAAVIWRPMVLGAIFQHSGNTLPAAAPAKSRYLLQDLARWASLYRVPFRFPSRFPSSTVKALRLCVQAEARGRQEALALRLFGAYWSEDADLTDDATLRRLLAEVDLPADQMLQGCADQAVKDALRAHTDEAAHRGVFGAPTFFVGDEMFWGNDRLHFVEAALRA